MSALPRRLVAVLIAGLVVAGAPPPQSGAFLSDTGTATDNPVTGGVLDPKLIEAGPATQGGTTDEGPADSVGDTWEDRDHDPLGSDNVSNTLTLDTAASSLAVDRVDFGVSYVENDSGGSAGNLEATARTVEVTEVTYGGTDLTTALDDTNGNSRLDLQDLANESDDELANRSGIAVGATANFSLTLSGSAGLLSGVGSGDGVDITVEVRFAGDGYAERDGSHNNTIRYG